MLFCFYLFQIELLKEHGSNEQQNAPAKSNYSVVNLLAFVIPNEVEAYFNFDWNRFYFNQNAFV